MRVHPVTSLPLLVVCLLAAGCTSPPWREIRDPVSAGTAKLFLNTGETTQVAVIEAFGGPNVVAGGSDGNETWTYDRMTYQHHRASFGGIGGGGGVLGSVPVGGLLWGSSSRASSGSRTVTLVLYWKSGVLKDYKYRSASF